MYLISGLCPRSDLSMGAWGFSVYLLPEFRDAVARSGIDQDKARTALDNMGRAWLDGCGFDSLFEYQGGSGPMYKPNLDLRVMWGEWGPEHITVPGDACGLDLGNGFGGPPGSQALHPHNVDSMAQAMLLTIVFTWFAENIALLGRAE